MLRKSDVDGSTRPRLGPTALSLGSRTRGRDRGSLGGRRWGGAPRPRRTMRRWQGRGAGRDTTSTLGVAEEMFDPTWDVVGARASVEFLG